MLPEVNQPIEVTIKSPSCSIYNDSGFDVSTIKGIRQRSECWDPPSTIRIFVGADMVPIRVVKLDRIIKISGSAVDLTKHDIQTWEVAGSKGAKYTVTRTGNEYRCDCAGFQFRKHCRHIEGVVK